MGFIAIDRSSENCSLPNTVDDFVPNNHLAKFIVLIVKLFDLTPFTSKYKGRGKPAYLPSVLLPLLLYSYATGVTSTRVMERYTYEHMPCVYICGFQHPDHNTIARFRKRFRAKIEDLFPEFLEILADLELLTSDTCYLDGTKINANASKHHAYSFGFAKKRLAKLKGD
jgi:transposase